MCFLIEINIKSWLYEAQFCDMIYKNILLLKLKVYLNRAKFNQYKNNKTNLTRKTMKFSISLACIAAMAAAYDLEHLLQILNND